MAQILQQLDGEWSELATSPRARRALIRWANSNPDLAGNRDLNDVLAARRDPERSGPVLKALAVLAPDDEVATRTLLQAMLPGLVRLAVVAGNDDPAAIDEVISLGWERIRTYPGHRPGSVAANVILDVRKRYRRHRRFEAPDSAELTEDEVLGRLLVDELVAAQRDGVMTVPVLETIIRTRLNGEPLADLAAEQSISPQLLCHRRWRAEVRLRDLPLAG